MAQHFGLTAPLLGASLPIGTGTEVGTFAAAGSVEAGGFGSVAYGNGITLLGGIAYEQERYRNAELKNAGTGAIALRYVLPSARFVNPFFEVGAWSAPNASLSFNRIYANGAGLGIGSGDTSGSLGYAFGRAGLVAHASFSDEWAVSGEFGYEWLHVRGYAEPLSYTNPFDAQISDGSDSLNVGKLRAQWTHGFSRQG